MSDASEKIEQDLDRASQLLTAVAQRIEDTLNKSGVGNGGLADAASKVAEAFTNVVSARQWQQERTRREAKEDAKENTPDE